ncbi:MAG: dienelactone hydrolase family protein [Anaerolineae bacterium]|nr:dienelactone hydrolase family protein [Anaerolineae bacterium]
MCYEDNDRPPLPEGSRGPASGEDLVLTSADGTQFAAYLALPGGSPSALALILPDVRGLHGFYKDLALRLAEVGIAAIGLDYFGRTAGLTPRDDTFEFWPHVQETRFPSILADAQASLAEARRRVGESTPSFTIGFCFGGTNSFFCGMEEGLGLTGVIGFYAGMKRDFGSGTLLDRAPQLRVPALGLFGGADQGIPVEQVEQFDQRLDQSGVEHEIIIYPGAPHSFFDRRAVEFADASADAWTRVRAFIARYS